MKEGGPAPTWAPKEGDIILMTDKDGVKFEMECFFCDSLGVEARFWGKAWDDSDPYEPGVAVFMIKSKDEFTVVDRVENRKRPVLPSKYSVTVFVKTYEKHLSDDHKSFDSWRGVTAKHLDNVAREKYKGWCKTCSGRQFDFWFEEDKANAEAFANEAKQHPEVEGDRVKVNVKRPLFESYKEDSDGKGPENDPSSGG